MPFEVNRNSYPMNNMLDLESLMGQDRTVSYQELLDIVRRSSGPILVDGMPRSGKTSLIEHLSQDLGSDLFPETFKYGSYLGEDRKKVVSQPGLREFYALNKADLPVLDYLSQILGHSVDLKARVFFDRTYLTPMAYEFKSLGLCGDRELAISYLKLVKSSNSIIVFVMSSLSDIVKRMNDNPDSLRFRESALKLLYYHYTDSLLYLEEIGRELNLLPKIYFYYNR